MIVNKVPEALKEWGILESGKIKRESWEKFSSATPVPPSALGMQQVVVELGEGDIFQAYKNQNIFKLSQALALALLAELASGQSGELARKWVAM